MRGRDYDPAGCERLLMKMLWLAPKLSGAACARHPQLFDSRHPDEDPDDAVERHERAVAECYQCPALAECREYAETLSRDRRVDGVLAARRPPKAGTAGRPRNGLSE